MEYAVHMPALLRGHGITRLSAQELAPVGKTATDWRTGRTVRLQAPSCEIWGNIIEVAQLVQRAREHFGRPYDVTSGYRDPMYNAAIGSTSMRHVRFGAIDGRVRGVSPRELADWYEQQPEADRMGLGVYPTFVHVDLLGARSRW